MNPKRKRERIQKAMEMTLRWYGSKFDTVTLKQIRQIPGVTGVITTLSTHSRAKYGAESASLP